MNTLHRWLAAACFAALGAAAAWAADNNFPTPGGATAPGYVNMCLNSSSQAVPCSGSSSASIAVISSPSGSASIGIVPVSTVLSASSFVLKASAGNLYGVFATNQTATAGFLVLLNQTSVPADGPITPIACVPLPATNGVASINYGSGPPAVYNAGIVAVFTSSTQCFIKTTTGNAAFFSGAVQ